MTSYSLSWNALCTEWGWTSFFRAIPTQVGKTIPLAKYHSQSTTRKVPLAKYHSQSTTRKGWPPRRHRWQSARSREPALDSSTHCQSPAQASQNRIGCPLENRQPRAYDFIARQKRSAHLSNHFVEWSAASTRILIGFCPLKRLAKSPSFPRGKPHCNDRWRSFGEVLVLNL